MKRISILGSTGSIGRQTLEVVTQFPEQFEIIGLGAGSNWKLLKEQILRFKPKVVSVLSEADAAALRGELLEGDGEGVPEIIPEIIPGDEGKNTVATHPDNDLLISAMVGSAGLEPTLKAIESQIRVALANKEVLVMAGELVTTAAHRRGVEILPIDSEHSAVFQALISVPRDTVRRIILTASGGPFRTLPREEMEGVTVAQALNHPTWSMGSKITIDSATLMNKGFELIEAKWLFDMGPEQISIWVHPQSIVHSMVEYIDGSFMAQMSLPDMKIPIAYALTYPKRPSLVSREIKPTDFSSLSFEEPDFERFPSLRLAYSSLETGGTMPAVLNAANEVAVSAFLGQRIGFTRIPELSERVMELHGGSVGRAESLEEVLDCDAWARREAQKIVNGEMLP